MDGFYLCKGNPRLDINYAKQGWNRSFVNLETVAEIPGVAPNGDSCGDIVADTSNNTHYTYNNIPSTSYCFYLSNFTYVAYVKAIGNQRGIMMLCRTQDVSYNCRVYFDIIRGEKVSFPAYDDFAHYDIQPLGDGWFKCTVVAKGLYNVLSSATTIASSLYLIDPNSDTSISYAGTGTDGVRVWKQFSFFGDDAEHYFPDLTELGAADYNRSPSQSVRFDPLWDAKFLETQALYDSTDLSGRRSQFITGGYGKWSFNVPVMEAHRAHMINEWWRNRDTVYFYNGLDYVTRQVAIVNKSEPFPWARAPYDNLMQGSLELEAVA